MTDLERREKIKQGLQHSMIVFFGLLFIKEGGVRRVMAGLVGDYYDGQIDELKKGPQPRRNVAQKIKEKEHTLSSLFGN